MSDMDNKTINWIYGFLSVASLALMKFLYNLTVENAAKKVELQIITKQNELEEKLDGKFLLIEDELKKLSLAVESNKRHSNKNAEHEIMMLNKIDQLLSKEKSGREAMLLNKLEKILNGENSDKFI